MLPNLKDALARFPSGVVVATTRDPQGAPWGFTASSFCAVSLEPALVSVCLAQTAECFPVFRACKRLNFNILSVGDTELAKRFATRGADKFGDAAFVDDPWHMPMLPGAVATLSCRRVRTIKAGDHVILVGGIDGIEMADGAESMVYYRRGFWSVERPAAPMRLSA